jgi:hypothetical protein
LNPDDPLIRRTCCFTSYGHGTWSFPRDLNSAIRFTRPTHRHLCLESNWSRWGESNSRVRVLQTRAFPLGYTRDLWRSHRELNSDPMFKRHLRFRYAIGAWYWRRDSNSHHALIRGLRLIKPLHFQLCYASRSGALGRSRTCIFPVTVYSLRRRDRYESRIIFHISFSNSHFSSY